MTLSDLEKAVATLSPDQLVKFRDWFEAFDAARFDERSSATPKPAGSIASPNRRSPISIKARPMLRIETEREDDGRWLAEVPALPGVMTYGVSDMEARAKATALALRVIAERVEHGEALPDII